MADPLVPGLFTISFPGGHCAQALWLAPHHTTGQALDLLTLEHPRPTLVIVGGAGWMESASMQRLQVLFNEVLAPLAQEMGLTVVDGGTDAGVMQLIGQARHRLGGTFPLVGVLPQGQARLNVHEFPECDLEPNHTHFLLIPGQDWGSESPWISALATALATPKPALTLLVNGGKVATTDFHINLAAGRPLLVLAGSGRFADEVAAALAAKTDDIPPDLREVVQRYQPSGALLSFDINRPADDLRHQLCAYFAGTDY